VFTDKTGTLTCNIMEFKIAVIGDRMYGDRSLLVDGNGDPAERVENTPAGIKGFYDH
jgi:magnesium-transporting ATPase (P-type)